MSNKLYLYSIVKDFPGFKDGKMILDLPSRSKIVSTIKQINEYRMPDVQMNYFYNSKRQAVHINDLTLGESYFVSSYRL